jgi:hypothetical protein
MRNCFSSRFLPPQHLQRLSGQNHGADLIKINYLKIAAIECDNGVRFPVHRRFQDHIVVWISQFRSPPKRELDGPGYCCKIILNSLNLPLVESACLELFGPAQDRLVFENQWHRQEHIKLTVKRGMQELPRRSSGAPQASDNYICVQNESWHVIMILHAIS